MTKAGGKKRKPASVRAKSKVAKPKKKRQLIAKKKTAVKPKRAARKKVAAKKPVAKAASRTKVAGKRKTAAKVSPLAPKSYPKMPEVAGVEFAAVQAGIKYKNRDDMLVAVFPEGTSVAGVFTNSKMPGAPVDWCRANIENGVARALVVNAGNSNVFTGKAGMATVRATAAKAAQEIGCRQKDVFIASTGVIGQFLPPEPLERGIGKAMKVLRRDNWEAAAGAIMTTDTFPKYTTRQVMIGGVPVRINGIAKGSGMVAPDLATMLVFIFTDAAIPAPILQTLLMLGTRDSFNAITVDSDTSTSDSVLLFATGEAMREAERETGQAWPPITRAGDPRLREFRTALHDLMQELAHQVVRDGEGATKFISVTVNGAASHQAARRIALSIANSPLVKTAIAGEDANWGRVVMAVGKAGEAADRDKLAVRMGGIDIAKNGVAVPGYDEAPVAKHMKGREIDIEVDVGVGTASATVWTCDLTHEYIAINADYRS